MHGQQIRGEECLCGSLSPAPVAIATLAQGIGECSGLCQIAAAVVTTLYSPKLWHPAGSFFGADEEAWQVEGILPVQASRRRRETMRSRKDY